MDRPLYEQLAQVTKALASPERLVLIELLAQSERTVEVLAERAGQTIQITSHHLQKLAAAGLVGRRRDGRHVVYTLADASVAEFWSALRGFAEARSGELRDAVRQVEARRRATGVITSEELERRLSRGTVTLIDVRPAEEFEAGHLEGARSLPLKELPRRLREIPRRHPVVAYCRSPYCQMADRAVELLHGRGYDARRLEEGVHEWSARGHRLEPRPKRARKRGDPAHVPANDR